MQASLKSSDTPTLAKAVADLAAQAPLFVQLGRSFNNDVGQSVEVNMGTSRRQPVRIYRVTDCSNQAEREVVINAIYSQVLDVFSGQVPDHYYCSQLDSKLRNGEISVREFVLELASSEIYRQRFCTPYPNTKVIEFIFRHLLGRAPATQGEISQYNQILADSGLRAAVEAIVNSQEYSRFFGEDVVPYQR